MLIILVKSNFLNLTIKGELLRFLTKEFIYVSCWYPISAGEKDTKNGTYRKGSVVFDRKQVLRCPVLLSFLTPE